MTKSQFFSNCTADSIREAAAALKAGHLVAFPTETVYGLGADAGNSEAVKRIYEVKGRPINHPLIVHVSSMSALKYWANEIPDYAIDLAKTFWPGPLTIVFKRTELARDFITGGQDSVGIRVPGNEIALSLLSSFESLGGVGIAAPSANRFGRVSPTSANDVEVEIGNFLQAGDLILNGGASDVGIESTIIDARDSVLRILRPGAVTEEMIEGVVGLKTCHKQLETNLRVSGSLKSHYAPKAKVIINQIPKPGQAFIALRVVDTPQGVERIAAPRSIEEFARCLYSGMREADNLGFTELVIEIPLEPGLANAILDRVSKSANSPII